MSSVGGSSGGSLSASAIVVSQAGGSGSHILRIDGYSLTKGLGKDWHMATKKFTAGGRPWCLFYYPNGGRRNSADSVAITLNCFDLAQVEAYFTISLLDQDGNRVPSYSRDYGYRFNYLNLDNEWGGDLIKRSELERSSAYLKNDTFWVRCDVTVPNKISTMAIPVSEVPGAAGADHAVKKKKKKKKMMMMMKQKQVTSSSGEC